MTDSVMTGPPSRWLVLLGALLAGSLAAQAASPIQAGEAPVLEERFTRSEDGLPAGWKPIVFRKIAHHTLYRVVQQDGRPALEAHADRSASGLVWEREFDPAQAPVVEWEWKISAVLARGDITAKAGDDLPARLFVMFPFDPERASWLILVLYEIYRLFYGEYPPGKALSYVWANRLPQGEVVPSAYTARLLLFAVESGPARAGEWVAERRNIARDFRRAFPGEPLPRRARIGIMVDTDDTQDVTTSWFAAIRVGPEEP